MKREEDDQSSSLFDSLTESEPQAPRKPLLHDVLLRDDPLYVGAKTTLGDALCALFVLFLTFHLSKLALQRVLDLQHALLPPNYLPTKVEDLLGLFSSSGKLVMHEYCESCLHLFKGQERRCVACQCWRYQGGEEQQGRRLKRTFFLELPLEQDVKELFQDAEFVRGLAYRFERPSSPGVLADIQDGAIYSTLMHSFLRHPHNLALAFNTDGVSPFKSSTYQLWPVYWQCLDLPPHLRFSTKFTRIAGLWFGSSKPDFNQFFQPLHTEIRRYYGQRLRSFLE